MKQSRLFLVLILILSATVAGTLWADDDYDREEPYRGSGEITPVADLEGGTLASIAGRIARIDDRDEIYLEDATGTAEVYAPGGFPPAVLEASGVITVHGWVDDDRSLRRRREVYAYTVVLEDGKEFTFNRQYD